VRDWLLGQIDEAGALDELSRLRINYDLAQSPENGFESAKGHWHVDSDTTRLGREGPGPPEHGGLWEAACHLVGEYEFADARILRGVYRRNSALLGRNMLLEGRFFGLRFYFGVRVTGVIDEERDAGDGPERVWGWCYQTLEGHLEQGRLSYEVIKHLTTGQVAFRVAGYSRPAPIGNAIVRLGSFCLAGGPSGASTGTSRCGSLSWYAERSAADRCHHPRYGRMASCWFRGASGRNGWNGSPRGGFTQETE